MKLPFSVQVYVHRIIHRDLQLECFKRRRAQLLSRYCSILNHEFSNK